MSDAEQTTPLFQIHDASVVRGGKTMDVDVTLDQQEEAVNGTNRSEQNNGSGQQGQQDQNGNGYDDGGVYDPFGFW